MEPSEVMQALYDSEITVRTEPDGCWDNGFRARIGDQQNGWKRSIIYGHTWDELMMNLARHVATKYPNSQFAEQYHAASQPKLTLVSSQSGNDGEPSEPIHR
jgi:hypothetical protein